MNLFRVSQWSMTTRISAIACTAVVLTYIGHLRFAAQSDEPIPHIIYILAILGTALFTGLSLTSNFPDKQMIHTTWIVVLAITLIPWGIFDICDHKFDTASLKFIVDYCAVLASTFSIIFVCYTLKLQRQQLRDSNRLTEQMRDKEILQLIDTFLSPEMTAHKEKCTALKEKLHLYRASTTNMLLYAFERSILDDCHTDPYWPGFRASTSYEEYAAFIRLARFFNLISHAPLSETTARSVHYYYVWWRRFIFQVGEIYQQAWDRTPPSQRLISIPAGWISACSRLDDIMKQYNLPIE